MHGSDGSSAPARFLFVGESGHLSGWAPNVPAPPPPSTQAQDAVVTPGAVDKGLALGQTDDGPMLYVADFSAGTVDVYNGLFQRVITAGNFQDRKLPDGFAPFNVAVLGGKVYVAYAKQDADREDEVAGAGMGRLDVFSLDGRLLDRAAGHGQLNAPWGLAIAPAGFGSFSGDLLVGNFGDGRIHAFDPSTLAPTGVVRGEDGRPVSIDGLWALQPGQRHGGWHRRGAVHGRAAGREPRPAGVLVGQRLTGHDSHESRGAAGAPGLVRGTIVGVMVDIGPAADALLEGLPEVRDRLHRVGVPSTFIPGPLMYAAEPVLTVVHDEEGKPLVRFASCGVLGDAMCIDPTTGAVWEVLNRSVPRRLFVSVALAVRGTVGAVAARFPFYDDPDDDRAAEQASRTWQY